MSRIGLKTINIPKETAVNFSGSALYFDGPMGSAKVEVPKVIKVEIKDDIISVTTAEDSIVARSLHGTTRSHINNAIIGVSEGWKKVLEIHGSGYRASIDGDILELHVGFSHTVKFDIPKSLEVKIVKNKITISGINKQEVGQFAAIIRDVRKPEPYKGKGIRYADEYVARKVGKALKATE